MNRRVLLRSSLGCLTIGLVAAAGPARAQAPGRTPPPDKPFADHLIALQLSDADPKRQRLVLSVANNLVTAYGPDQIAIEVVAFGPGVELLFDTAEHRAQVDSLIAQGVRFDICGNTLDTIQRETGMRPAINPRAVEVQVGVGHLLTLSERGYTLVRP